MPGEGLLIRLGWKSWSKGRLLSLCTIDIWAQLFFVPGRAGVGGGGMGGDHLEQHPWPLPMGCHHPPPQLGQ